jgi:hypothetical protein
MPQRVGENQAVDQKNGVFVRFSKGNERVRAFSRHRTARKSARSKNQTTCERCSGRQTLPT